MRKTRRVATIAAARIRVKAELREARRSQKRYAVEEKRAREAQEVYAGQVRDADAKIARCLAELTALAEIAKRTSDE